MCGATRCGLTQKGSPGAGKRATQWSSRTEREKIREGRAAQSAVAKGKNEVYISGPVYDDDGGDAEDTHTHTQKEGFSSGVTAGVADPKFAGSATASESCELLKKNVVVSSLKNSQFSILTQNVLFLIQKFKCKYTELQGYTLLCVHVVFQIFLNSDAIVFISNATR